jgi:hypothetical protein
MLAAAVIVKMLESLVPQVVKMVQFDLRVEWTILKVVWRSVSMINGALSVTKCGMSLMLQ